MDRNVQGTTIGRGHLESEPVQLIKPAPLLQSSLSPPHYCMSVPPPVPIIDSVEVAVLGLFEVEVNISLLSNRGGSVTHYIVNWFTCVLSIPCLKEKHIGPVESGLGELINSADCISFAAGSSELDRVPLSQF